MRDITYCTAQECPSTECKIKITNNHFTSDELVSVADFAGVCRFYIGWILSEVENDSIHGSDKR